MDSQTDRIVEEFKTLVYGIASETNNSARVQLENNLVEQCTSASLILVLKAILPNPVHAGNSRF